MVPLRYLEWVSNLVLVRKKTEDISLCIEFSNLNKASLKDNYPFPKMDYIFQRVVASKRISLFDGFSGHNQVLVLLSDQNKTAFTLPWGTFMYVKIPFELMNAWATFQRAMDIAFLEDIGYFLVMYLDEITVYSKTHEEHLFHLRKVFKKCRKYDLSLNPKKTLFRLHEGKLLGHIISEEGIKIDPKMIEGILQIIHPRNIKELQYFIGKINLLRRFIPNLSQFLRNITSMLRKEIGVNWTLEAKQYFELVK